jgi:hypothetical protein
MLDKTKDWEELSSLIMDFYRGDADFEEIELKFKTSIEKIKTDLLKVADEGEYEDLRREVLRYFNPTVPF